MTWIIVHNNIKLKWILVVFVASLTDEAKINSLICTMWESQRDYDTQVAILTIFSFENEKYLYDITC